VSLKTSVKSTEGAASLGWFADSDWLQYLPLTGRYGRHSMAVTREFAINYYAKCEALKVTSDFYPYDLVKSYEQIYPRPVSCLHLRAPRFSLHRQFVALSKLQSCLIMRSCTRFQIFGFILSFFIPPIAVYFTEGCGIDFWIDCLLCCFGIIPGSIYATYIWIVWVERKWQTKHGQDVTSHPPLIFSKEFEERSRWKGNGQDGVFGTPVLSPARSGAKQTPTQLIRI